MSRFFTVAACALTLLGPAAFAQSSMGNSMSSPTSGTMSPNTTKPSDSMKKPETGMTNGNTMAPANSMAPGNTMAPANSMGNSMSHPATTTPQ